MNFVYNLIFCALLGLVFGAVLGDTIGVATEYLTTDENEFYYGEGIQ